MKKSRIKNLDLRYFAIPFSIIFALFSVFMYRDVMQRVEGMNEELEHYALAITDRYTSSLLNASDAQEIIEQLLEDKLQIVSEAILLLEDRKDSDKLTEIGERFQVDEIHLYDPSGEIIYSKENKYVGWKAYEGHPVDAFMKSGEKYLVEDIRKDSESENYYKYAYIRDADGSFIQIGIHTDKIRYFLDRFTMQRMLDQLADYDYIHNLMFISSDLKVEASSLKEYIGRPAAENQFVKTLATGEIHTERTVLKNQEVFRVSVPVKRNGYNYGILAVYWETAQSSAEIRGIIFQGVLKFTVVSVMLFSIMYYGYRKNRRNIQLAFYDELTGLPNQTYLEDHLEELLTHGKQKKVALMMLNCNNFKVLNMTYGYRYGNDILKEMAKKLEAITGKNRKIFRFDGDRFAVVVGDYKDKDQLRELGEEVLSLFKHPISTAAGSQFLSMELSIVENKNQKNTSDKMIQDAALALSSINHNEQFAISFYEEAMEDQLKRQDRIEKVLRGCILNFDDEQFSLAFQPKVNLATNEVEGFEALARLNVEGVGPISPLEFISIAEERHLIYDLGNLIFWRTGQFLEKLKERGYEDMTVSVNVSGIQLLRETFLTDFQNILKICSISPERLELEITESVLLSNYELVNRKLEQIKEKGILISLDDFGTGFSSLSRLRDMNIDIVKIDKYFIDKIVEHSEDKLITADIISMAHKFGLQAVAEGVEEKLQMDYLIKYHCDVVQGYYISKPLSAKEAVVFLDEKKQNKTDQ
ncbi:putative bifunctional diguanylate cyclase/phosphodiesterase [Proteiniclasticum ruminis]|uniref:Diguanylate cyclase (GGDEF) domain-containing protein n=1 Tax=Proteiniclasticum ruminis TaxID=398199 RepID=A0A1I5EDA3_9CLOT|nr:bifunctional diguanylate cyclase/phosphodiesterase [Proteiniclasticum ruminis]SFO09333.1 diguanylate cyclase (GGDEF) domain-containing protein [Proteiniclasticum ruminis]